MQHAAHRRAGPLGHDGPVPEMIPYVEFAYFADNASEFGLSYDGPPEVRRVDVPLGDGRLIAQQIK